MLSWTKLKVFNTVEFVEESATMIEVCISHACVILRIRRCCISVETPLNKLQTASNYNKKGIPPMSQNLVSAKDHLLVLKVLSLDVWVHFFIVSTTTVLWAIMLIWSWWWWRKISTVRVIIMCSCNHHIFFVFCCACCMDTPGLLNELIFTRNQSLYFKPFLQDVYIRLALRLSSNMLRKKYSRVYTASMLRLRSLRQANGHRPPSHTRNSYPWCHNCETESHFNKRHQQGTVRVNRVSCSLSWPYKLTFDHMSDHYRGSLENTFSFLYFLTCCSLCIVEVTVTCIALVTWNETLTVQAFLHLLLQSNLASSRWAPLTDTKFSEIFKLCYACAVRAPHGPMLRCRRCLVQLLDDFWMICALYTPNFWNRHFSVLVSGCFTVSR